MSIALSVSSPPTTTAVSVYRGEDVVLDFTYTPLTDITGFTFACTIARSKNSATKLIEATPSITLEAAGTFSVSIASADIEALAPGKYYWDVWKIDSGINGPRLNQILGIGVFTVLANVRKP